MTDIRQEIHEEIDRMNDEETTGLKEFLKTYPDKLGASLRNCPVDPEPLTDEVLASLDEAEEWFKHNEGIPHEEIVRELGLR